MELKGKIDNYHITDDGVLKLTIAVNIADSIRMINYAEALKNNEKTANIDLKIAINEWKEKRSLNANAYFHKLVDELAKWYNKPTSEVKRDMVLEYGVLSTKNGYIDCAVLPANVDIRAYWDYAEEVKEININGVVCKQYKLYRPTHEYDSKQMYHLIQGVRFECEVANEDGANIRFLTPDEEERMWAEEKAYEQQNKSVIN